MCVREGEATEKGEGFSAKPTEAAVDRNPVMVLIVGLLLAPAVADDRILFAERASPRKGLGASGGPICFQVAFLGRKWDTYNRGKWGFAGL
jgi:hypothetical protein